MDRQVISPVGVIKASNGAALCSAVLIKVLNKVFKTALRYGLIRESQCELELLTVVLTVFP
jgi:hypothetical protein